uniref:DNA polymerase delta subunit 3 n=1 Tax=Ciona savignyi TaxID=51511 RepID=H2ZCZ1_CIOSA
MQEEEEMEIIPASPKPPPKPSIKNGEKNSRTKRVLKSKTFVDADGSMLTEKEWVEEPSLSGEEDDKNDKQTESITIKKLSPKANKKPANKKSKQSSLMGFFSKNS